MHLGEKAGCSGVKNKGREVKGKKQESPERAKSSELEWAGLRTATHSAFFFFQEETVFAHSAVKCSCTLCLTVPVPALQQEKYLPSVLAECMESNTQGGLGGYLSCCNMLWESRKHLYWKM